MLDAITCNHDSGLIPSTGSPPTGTGQEDEGAPSRENQPGEQAGPVGGPGIRFLLTP
jgi:hypothetical protein